MDFGNASKLIPLGNNLVVPRSDVLATVGGVAVDLSPEKTVQSAQAGDAVRVDIGQRDQRDLQQDAQDKRIETDRRQDQARRESEFRATSLQDVIERRLVIDPPTRTVVLQKTNVETGETVQTLPDEATLKLRRYSREIAERARLTEDATARYIERTA
ncbi:MAG: hypothetical protein K2Z25_07420 [Beijerinckiaceae bacterium]|nr:hypothetical protein [Beijerinckiaceae bacterium]